MMLSHANKYQKYKEDDFRCFGGKNQKTTKKKRKAL
jgi:hypothetical protein